MPDLVGTHIVGFLTHRLEYDKMFSRFVRVKTSRQNLIIDYPLITLNVISYYTYKSSALLNFPIRAYTRPKFPNARDSIDGMLLKKGTSRQRSGKGAIRKRFPLRKPR